MNKFSGFRLTVFFFFWLLLFSHWSLSSPSPALAACQCAQVSSTGYQCNADCGDAFGGISCIGNASACTTATNSAQCSQQNSQSIWLETFKMCGNFQDFLNIVVTWGMLIATALALIRLVAGGIQFIYASGEPKSLEEARATITSAILGLVLVVCSFLITRFIQSSLPSNWLIRFGVNP